MPLQHHCAAWPGGRRVRPQVPSCSHGGGEPTSATGRAKPQSLPVSTANGALPPRLGGMARLCSLSVVATIWRVRQAPRAGATAVGSGSLRRDRQSGSPRARRAKAAGRVGPDPQGFGRTGEHNGGALRHSGAVLL